MLAWHGSCNRDSGDVTFNACLCQCFKSLQLSYRRNLCVAGAAVHQSNKDFAIHINSYHFNSHLHTSVCFVSQLMTSLAFQPQPSSHLSSPSFFFTLHSTCTAQHSRPQEGLRWSWNMIPRATNMFQNECKHKLTHLHKSGMPNPTHSWEPCQRCHEMATNLGSTILPLASPCYRRNLPRIFSLSGALTGSIFSRSARWR